MAIRYRQFIHPSDTKAQKALEAIPAFKHLAKEVMNMIGERTFYIENMSGKIKLSEKQMPDIYNLLPPICEKLGIDVPELYLELDRNPNAYTFGDSEVAIVLTSGLIETLSKDEIQVAIAHECGHILCHHALYKTIVRMFTGIGNLFLNGSLGNLVKLPVLAALCYWNRCSEFSADRVAAYYIGSSNLVSDLMMRLAGGTKNLETTLNKEAFLQQASEYKEYIDSSRTDKLFEVLLYAFHDHPLLAYRAYEITDWCNSEEFFNIDPTIVVDVPEDSKYIDISQDVIQFVDASYLLNWFKENNPTNAYKNIAIHCGICKDEKYLKKFAKYLKKLSFNASKTIVQAIVDEQGNVVKNRLILFSSIEQGLKNLFIEKNGILIVK